MSPSSSVSFLRDVVPLFRPTDIEHMTGFGVFLHNYEWMSQPSNASSVHRYLSGQSQPQMPLGGPYWSGKQLAMLKRWIDGGFQP